MFVLYDIWVFVLLIEIITIAKLLIIVHFFILQHEKQILSYIHITFESNENNRFFFLQFVLWGHQFFAPTLKTTLASEVDVPVNYLV